MLDVVDDATHEPETEMALTGDLLAAMRPISCNTRTLLPPSELDRLDVKICELSS